MFLHRRPSTTSYSHKATSNISDLNQDLVNRHGSIDASCNVVLRQNLLNTAFFTVHTAFRHVTTSSKHFSPRDMTIFLTVHEFIDRTNRAGVVDRTTTKGIYSFFCLPT